MLVLTRKQGERIIIGEGGDISIVVVELRSDRVKIGINAPKEIPVHREEVWLQIKEEERKKDEG